LEEEEEYSPLDEAPMLSALTSLAFSSGDPALRGYDVVEYFSLPASASGVAGSSDFSFDLLMTDAGTASPKMTPSNYTFLFKDAANLATFKANPFKYTPKWGGF
jgi:hypothetical protein